MPIVSVWDSKELQGAIYAMKIASAGLRKEIYKRTREKVLPEWTEAVATEIGQRSYSGLGYALSMKATRVAVSQENIRLNAATSTRKSTSGGLIPARDYYLYEFGATPRVGQVQGRRGNTRYNYTRMLGKGLPPKTKYGRGAYKAANKIGTRALALWVSSIVQIYNDAARGKTL
jgi:hypothetical protein